MGATMAGLVLVLVLVGVAFGSSSLLFPALIAAVAGLGVGVFYVVRTAATASGEGSDPAHSPR